MVFQRFNLFPHMNALQNVMVGLTEVRKVPKAEAKQQASALLDRVGLCSVRTPTRTSFPAASSSASRSPGRS